MAVSIVGLLILVLMLALAVGAVVLIVLGLVKRNPGATDSGVCGGCGYAVRGLTSLNCPECGADLRQVGINRPSSGKGGLVMLVSGLALAGLLLMCVCSGAIFAFRTTSMVQVQPVVATPTQPAQPVAPQPLP